MHKFEYRAWRFVKSVRSGQLNIAEGVQEEFIVKNPVTANRVAWSRAVSHLLDDDGIGTIQMEYIKKIS